MTFYIIVFAFLALAYVGAKRFIVSYAEGHDAREARILAEANADMLAFYPGKSLHEITDEMREKFCQHLKDQIQASYNKIHAQTYRPKPVDVLAAHTITGGRIVGNSGKIVCENINDLSGPERDNLIMSLQNGSI